MERDVCWRALMVGREYRLFVCVPPTAPQSRLATTALRCVLRKYVWRRSSILSLIHWSSCVMYYEYAIDLHCCWYLL